MTACKQDKRPSFMENMSKRVVDTAGKQQQMSTGKKRCMKEIEKKGIGSSPLLDSPRSKRREVEEIRWGHQM
jgi:hypothetical protein